MKMLHAYKPQRPSNREGALLLTASQPGLKLQGQNMMLLVVASMGSIRGLTNLQSAFEKCMGGVLFLVKLVSQP
jgi:hypothetical protein